MDSSLNYLKNTDRTPLAKKTLKEIALNQLFNIY